MGSLFLGGFVFLGGLLFVSFLDQPNVPIPVKQSAPFKHRESFPSLLTHELHSPLSSFDLSFLKDRVSIALCPSKPHRSLQEKRVDVVLKSSNESVQLSAPARLGLYLESGHDGKNLHFQEDDRQFWLECNRRKEVVEASLCLKSFGEEEMATWTVSEDPAHFLSYPSPLLKQEPFYSLSKGRCLGRDLLIDLLMQKDVRKVFLGGSCLDFFDQDLLFWDGQTWLRGNDPSQLSGRPVAKIYCEKKGGCRLEMWDETGDRYAQVILENGFPEQKRYQIQDWFHSVRVRSDKQMSCTIDQQCMILKEGDWVLKEKGRWKALRKKEEKQRLCFGEKQGDLLVVERIDVQNKMVSGRLIVANRVQQMPFSLSASSCVSKKSHTIHRLTRSES